LMALSHVFVAVAAQGLAHPEPTATTGAETTVATTPLLLSAVWRLDEDARRPFPVVRLIFASAAAVAEEKAMLAATLTEAAERVMVTALDATPAPVATVSRIWFRLVVSKSTTSPESSKLTDTAGGDAGKPPVVGAIVGAELVVVGVPVGVAVGNAVGATVGAIVGGNGC